MTKKINHHAFQELLPSRKAVEFCIPSIEIKLGIRSQLHNALQNVVSAKASFGRIVFCHPCLHLSQSRPQRISKYPTALSACKWEQKQSSCFKLSGIFLVLQVKQVWILMSLRAAKIVHLSRMFLHLHQKQLHRPSQPCEHDARNARLNLATVGILRFSEVRR